MLIGGKVAGEGSALADKRGHGAWYKNIAGEAVAVDPSIKEIAPGYGDVANGSWYAKDFYQLVYEGILKGYPGSGFAPHGNVTRAEFVTLLARYAKADLSGYGGLEPIYPDVGASDWHSPPIAWGTEKGIIKGQGNGSFRPNDNVTREQMAVMLFRYAEYMGTDTNIERVTDIGIYSDIADVSGWAAPAMQWAVDAGLIKGVRADRLAPKEPATRAEMAVLLGRMA